MAAQRSLACIGGESEGVRASTAAERAAALEDRKLRRTSHAMGTHRRELVIVFDDFHARRQPARGILDRGSSPSGSE
jgi:hypothetical protein